MGSNQVSNFVTWDLSFRWATVTPWMSMGPPWALAVIFSPLLRCFYIFSLRVAPRRGGKNRKEKKTKRTHSSKET